MGIWNRKIFRLDGPTVVDGLGMAKRLATAVTVVLLAFAPTVGIVARADALGANLVPNPSAESGTGNAPTSWAPGKWGTNTATFTRVSGGHSGSYALNVRISAFTSGDAKWYFTPVAIAPNTSYTVSNWYQSTTGSTVAAVITSQTGAVSYASLGTPGASSSWKQNIYTFMTPADAAKMTIYHFIESVGELTVDDYTLATTDTAPPPTGTNLVVNPSLESSTGQSLPASWYYSTWGTNSTSFTYATNGYTGNRSARITTSSYTSGGSHWLYNSVPVVPGKTYQHSNWYNSSVKTGLYARITLRDNSVKEFWLNDAPASGSWAQLKTRVTAPMNAARMAIFQSLRSVGTLSTDDYSLTEQTPAPYARPIVSLTFDDGWSNEYTNARPVLNNVGFDATYYLISGTLNTQYYMTNAQVRSLNTEGNEIASQSVTHRDFSTLSAAQVETEFSGSKTALQNLIGAPVTSFAYPYGAYTASTRVVGQGYYASQRSIDWGLNYRDDIDITRLKSIIVTRDTTAAEFQNWVDDAIAQRAWIILTYHEIANTPVVPGDALGTVTPAKFTAQMNYLKGRGVSVQPIRSALSEVQGQ